MADNPYAPPKASVEDVKVGEVEMEKPSQVVTAVRLLWTSVAIGIVNSVLSIKFIASTLSIPFMIGTLCATFLINAWLISKLSIGRNWARITLLVFALIGFPVALVGLPLTIKMFPLVSLVSIVQMVMQVVALWLVFRKPGREWFAPRY